MRSSLKSCLAAQRLAYTETRYTVKVMWWMLRMPGTSQIILLSPMLSDKTIHYLQLQFNPLPGEESVSPRNQLFLSNFGLKVSIAAECYKSTPQPTSLPGFCKGATAPLKSSFLSLGADSQPGDKHSCRQVFMKSSESHLVANSLAEQKVMEKWPQTSRSYRLVEIKWTHISHIQQKAG